MRDGNSKNLRLDKKDYAEMVKRISENGKRMIKKLDGGYNAVSIETLSSIKNSYKSS